MANLEEDLYTADVADKATLLDSFIASGGDINGQNIFGSTVLILSGRCGTEYVSLLLDRGSDPDLVDNHGMSALVRMSEFGMDDCVEVLLKGGADVNLKDNTGMSALMWAVQKGKTGCAKHLLDYGADVNSVTNHGWTALMWAALEDHKDCVDLLLNGDANADIADEVGSTALEVASTRFKSCCIDSLVPATSDIECIKNTHMHNYRAAMSVRQNNEIRRTLKSKDRKSECSIGL